MVIFVINRIFTYVMREKSIQFKIINEQKEILLTSEEELRAHNEMLNEFNASLEEKQELLEHLAYTDTLTGLENRKKMKEKIDDLILLNRQHNKVFTLVFIDLNEFKKINNIAGHGIGDKFLIKIADRIRAHVDHEDLVFRIGGDEFAIIINREISDENLLIYLRYMMHSIKSPVLIENHQLYVNASCSVARWPLDGTTCSELLIAADTAMHEVKNTKGNDIYFFNKALRSKKLNRIELEYELLKALKNEEFLLHYQPLLRADDKKILGFEALIRWQSSKYGFVSPMKFIPVAEEIGLIYEIGKWVILEVCNMMNRLGDGASNYMVSINVSSIQLKNPHFLMDVENILSKTKVDPRRLKFEITESVLIDDVEKVTDIINDIRRIGISIAIDDFGTGFSSLSYLINIPIDILKIDRSFIDRILTSRKKRGLINSIIDMAHNLDMSVIAEGVETEKQADYLTSQHCDILQGYYFSKPVDERTLFKMIEKQK
jgi:diguanylate cyclase (GGDEF)-like protein